MEKNRKNRNGFEDFFAYLSLAAILTSVAFVTIKYPEIRRKDTKNIKNIEMIADNSYDGLFDFEGIILKEHKYEIMEAKEDEPWYFWDIVVQSKENKNDIRKFEYPGFMAWLYNLMLDKGDEVLITIYKNGDYDFPMPIEKDKAEI